MIRRIIVENKIGNEHRNKCKIKEEIRKTSTELMSKLSLLEYAALHHKPRKNIRKQETKWKATHRKKVIKLTKNREKRR